ncbi:MAG: F0F1 ATP synthase subunit A [Candidatus Kapabacteria bacterium]|nr:F0F1 ATP synthase subunit A [Candidatus Kapabacteria bacterium]
MAKNIDGFYTESKEINKDSHIDNNLKSQEHNGSHSDAGHGGGHNGGDIPPSEVFPVLLKGLGEHRELTFFHYHLIDLPVILYDGEYGLKIYPSVNSMNEAGIYTLDHHTHQIVKTKDHHQTPALDLSVTSLVVFQWLAIIIVLVAFIFGARRYKKNENEAPKGIQNLLEATITFLRDKVIEPNIGGKHISDRLLPYFIGLFFFILLMNLFGLIPGGHTATGALGTTAGLALTALFVINWTAIKEIGLGNWFKHLLGGAPWWLSFIMVPIEIISMFTKPFALTVRLFANMTAGHVVLLSLVGLIFYFKSLAVAPVSVAFSIFMYALELLVAFLQAYIFTILTAVFTGLAVGDHSHGGEEKHAH